MAEVTGLRHNALPYPVYGAPWGVVFPMLDADGDLVTGATTPDAEVSLNGNTFSDCTNESTEIATNSGMYYLLLTAAEMTADVVTIIAKSATAGMKTTPMVLYPRKLVSLRTGTSASAGSATSTIVLDASASAIDDFYNGCLVVAVIDTLTEVRVISDYTGSTQTATVVPDWNVAPDNNDTFTVYIPDGGMQIRQANTTLIASAAVSTSSAQIGVNVVNAGGTVWASGSLTSGVFAAGAITATSIAADAITAAKVADGTIDAATFAAGAINAAAIAADAITDAKVASDVTIASVTGAVGSVTGAVGSVTGNVGGNVTGSVGSVASGGIAAASFATGAVDAAALAADAGTEIGTAVWASGTRILTAGTNIALAKGTGVTGFNDLSAAQVNAEADTALADVGVTLTVTGRIDAAVSTRASQTSVDTIDDFVDTEVAAIKTKTDQLTFTQAGHVDANIQRVNDVLVTGTGSSGDPWGP